MDGVTYHFSMRQFTPTTFALTVSMTDFVLYYGEGDDDLISHPLLVEVFRLLRLQVDARALYLEYFDQVRVGGGDMIVFNSTRSPRNRFAIDMYRDASDQQDLIRFAVLCHPLLSERVRFHLRAFFDATRCPIAYEETVGSTRIWDMFDTGRYPLAIEGTEHVQQVREIQA